ncbi:MAG: ADP-ribosylglycohydrolase family protein [Alphaproteobacteria bacterium]|nr:ADP-ribosylglycohydrolase family protein [Alphaproteobacteria bacterium]
MLGAVAGDIIGSRFEWRNYKAKDFELFGKYCHFTDDSVMTIAVAKALLECNGNYENLSDKAISSMQQIGKLYPSAGYGGSFCAWLLSNDPKPYNSWGNGSAMRVSACAYIARSLDEAMELSHKVTCITHNHPEGLKGAEATTVATYMALHGSTKEEIRQHILDNYYNIDYTLDDIRDSYHFDVSCQGSVPQALQAFFESTDYEDAIRNAISIGGDSDTIAAITGAVACAYYGMPNDIKEKAYAILTPQLKEIVDIFDTQIKEA